MKTCECAVLCRKQCKNQSINQSMVLSFNTIKSWVSSSQLMTNEIGVPRHIHMHTYMHQDASSIAAGLRGEVCWGFVNGHRQCEHSKRLVDSTDDHVALPQHNISVPHKPTIHVCMYGWMYVKHKPPDAQSYQGSTSPQQIKEGFADIQVHIIHVRPRGWASTTVTCGNAHTPAIDNKHRATEALRV